MTSWSFESGVQEQGNMEKHAGQREMQHRVDPDFKRCGRRWTLLS